VPLKISFSHWLVACILELWEMKVTVYSKKEMKTLLAFEDAFNFLSGDLTPQSPIEHRGE